MNYMVTAEEGWLLVIGLILAMGNGFVNSCLTNCMLIAVCRDNWKAPLHHQ